MGNNGLPLKATVLGTHGLHSLIEANGLPLCFNYSIAGRALVLVRFRPDGLDAIVVNPYCASDVCDCSNMPIGITETPLGGRPIKYLSSKLQLLDSTLIRKGYDRELIPDSDFVHLAAYRVDGVEAVEKVKFTAAGVPSVVLPSKSLSPGSKAGTKASPSPNKVETFPLSSQSQDSKTSPVPPSVGGRKRGRIEL